MDRRSAASTERGMFAFGAERSAWAGGGVKSGAKGVAISKVARAIANAVDATRFFKSVFPSLFKLHLVTSLCVCDGAAAARLFTGAPEHELARCDRAGILPSIIMEAMTRYLREKHYISTARCPESGAINAQCVFCAQPVTK
eukprot:1180823-Prorocentrum_minimum.AAC.3